MLCRSMPIFLIAKVFGAIISHSWNFHLHKPTCLNDSSCSYISSNGWISVFINHCLDYFNFFFPNGVCWLSFLSLTEQSKNIFFWFTNLCTISKFSLFFLNTILHFSGNKPVQKKSSTVFIHGKAPTFLIYFSILQGMPCMLSLPWKSKQNL